MGNNTENIMNLPTMTEDTTGTIFGVSQEKKTNASREISDEEYAKTLDKADGMVYNATLDNWADPDGLAEGYDAAYDAIRELSREELQEMVDNDSLENYARNIIREFVSYVPDYEYYD